MRTGAGFISPGDLWYIMSGTVSDPVPRFEDLNETEKELVQRLRGLVEGRTQSVEEFIEQRERN